MASTMTLKIPAIALAAAAQLLLLSAPAYADDVNPAPSPGVEVGPEVEVGPAVEIGPPADPFVQDIVDMISEGTDLAPPSA